MDDTNKLMLEAGLEMFCGPIQQAELGNLIKAGGYAGALKALLQASKYGAVGPRQQISYASKIIGSDKAKTALADTRLHESDELIHRRQAKLDAEMQQRYQAKAQQAAHENDVTRVMTNATSAGLMPNLIARYKVEFPLCRREIDTVANVAFREWVWQGAQVNQ